MEEPQTRSGSLEKREFPSQHSLSVTVSFNRSDDLSGLTKTRWFVLSCWNIGDVFSCCQKESTGEKVNWIRRAMFGIKQENLEAIGLAEDCRMETTWRRWVPAPKHCCIRKCFLVPPHSAQAPDSCSGSIPEEQVNPCTSALVWALP